MPVYAYKGVAANGRNTRGHLDAESLRSARARLKRDGIFLRPVACHVHPLEQFRQSGSSLVRRIMLTKFDAAAASDPSAPPGILPFMRD